MKFMIAIFLFHLYMCHLMTDGDGGQSSQPKDKWFSTIGQTAFQDQNQYFRRFRQRTIAEMVVTIAEMQEKTKWILACNNNNC